MRLTKGEIKDAVDCAELCAVDELAAAYQRVDALLTNLTMDIASMRDCDRKRTMKAVAADVRRALYGEG